MYHSQFAWEETSSDLFYYKRIMAYYSSAVCGVIFFLVFLIIEQVKLLEINYEEEFDDYDRPNVHRFHMPYQPIHMDQQEFYDHEASDTSYIGILRPDMAYNEYDDYETAIETPILIANNNHQEDGIPSSSSPASQQEVKLENTNNHSTLPSSKPIIQVEQYEINGESISSSGQNSGHKVYIDKPETIATQQIKEPTSSITIQEANMKSGHFRWRILTDLRQNQN